MSHIKFKDDRLYYKESEVALDFNAAYQAAASGVVQHLLLGPSTEMYGILEEITTSTTTTPATTAESNEPAEQSSSNNIYISYLLLAIIVYFYL